jgi:pimeloyl-ACP methyl ester carboxylesterase
MTIADVNGIRLFYEITGQGRCPLVLVHGSWVSHASWDSVVPRLAKAFRVVTYDRRGHSDSERPAGPGSVHEDVADLAALLEQLGLAPTLVAGNSFGASIALRLAAERPELLQGVVAHEPPLFQLLADNPGLAPMLEEVRRRVGALGPRIASGDHAGAAEQFVETVALGPGSWEQLPSEIRRTMIENAPTFLDETADAEALTLDLDRLRRVDRPVLLTMGDQSPPAFPPVVRRLAAILPRAEVLTLEGVGHVPHLTHPDLYVETVTTFVRRYAAA